jgi:molybdopterin synthase catalytic subunit/molybdopterin converting factor small subunit
VRVRVLFFGLVRDVIGRPQEDLELPGARSLGDVFEHYAAAHPGLRDLSRSILLSRNAEFARRSEMVQDGDEIAFLPPVSGGSSNGYTHEILDVETGNFFALTFAEIDSKAVAERLLRGADGAVVDFLGVVRNNTKGRATRFLDYECYAPMAIKEMARIGREIAATHSIGRIAIVHRLGRMLIGEASVAVVVTSPHRRPAFEAALAGIDRLKKTVPIWKKEYFVDGEVWVEGEWDEALKAKP